MNLLPNNYAERKSDVPKEKHWAILHFATIHIPGDQRSKDFPGHGYPAEYKPVVRYDVYLSREKWAAKIISMESNSSILKDYVAIEVNPAKIYRETKIIVDV